MPNIADQVAAIEHDLNAALATIDQLTAANSALVSANASLQRDNVALQLEANDMKHYVDDTRTMADELAASALEMLRASRRHVGPAPIAPKSDGDKFLAMAAKIDALPEKWPAQQAERIANLAGVTTEGAILPGVGRGINRDPSPMWKNNFAPLTGLRETDTIADGEAMLDARAAQFVGSLEHQRQQAVADIMASDATLLDRDSGDEQPDRNCVTRADGECVAEDVCMHTQRCRPTSSNRCQSSRSATRRSRRRTFAPSSGSVR
jgi:hypothetical protein